MHGHANTWEEELQEVCAERDAPREQLLNREAEIEKSRARARRRRHGYRRNCRAEVDEINRDEEIPVEEANILRAHVALLKARLDDQRLEIERGRPRLRFSR